MSLLILLVIIYFFVSTNVLVSFKKNTNILSKARGSKDLTLERRRSQGKKLDTLEVKATSLWHSCMICERHKLYHVNEHDNVNLTTLCTKMYVKML